MFSGAGTTHRALGVYFTRIAGVRSPACADRTGIFYRETAARSGYRWPCGVWPAWPWVCQFVAATFALSRGLEENSEHNVKTFVRELNAWVVKKYIKKREG